MPAAARARAAADALTPQPPHARVIAPHPCPAPANCNIRQRQRGGALQQRMPPTAPEFPAPRPAPRPSPSITALPAPAPASRRSRKPPNGPHAPRPPDSREPGQHGCSYRPDSRPPSAAPPSPHRPHDRSCMHACADGWRSRDLHHHRRGPTPARRHTRWPRLRILRGLRHAFASQHTPRPTAGIHIQGGTCCGSLRQPMTWCRRLQGVQPAAAAEHARM